MNPTITVVFIVLMAVLVSLIGLVLVRRLAPIDQLAQHTDVAGYVYAVVGVIYAVVLALVVIAAWEEYRDAREAVADEASAVLNMARAANGWPADDRDEVESALTAYARQVVDVEWPAMARGDFGPTADTVTVNRLWQALNEADESAATKSASYEAALQQLDDLGAGPPQPIAPRPGGSAHVDGGDPDHRRGGHRRLCLHLCRRQRSAPCADDRQPGRARRAPLLLQFQLGMPFQGVSAIEPTAMKLVLAEIDSAAGIPGMNP